MAISRDASNSNLSGRWGRTIGGVEMIDQNKDGKSAIASTGRRSVLKAGATVAGALALGFPAIVRAQSDKIKIGHLTPLTGFLGALGAYAQLGIKMAADEINHAGG